MKIEALRSPESIRAEARQFLRATDWIVISRHERGEDVPQDVTDARAAARKAASSDTPAHDLPALARLWLPACDWERDWK